jgi:hypothetical protein
MNETNTVDLSHLSDLEKKLVRDIVNGSADVQPDNDGQLVIYTGFMVGDGDKLVEWVSPYDDEEEESEDD